MSGMSRPCPVCSTSSPIIMTKLEREEYTICRECGLLFTHAPVSIDDFETYYDDGRGDGRSYHEDYLVSSSEHNRNRALARQMQHVSDESWKKKDVLEIGSSIGYLLDEARVLGARVRGIEISREASKYANEELQIKTINCNWEIFDIDEFHWRSRFDFVCMSHVLEHFVDPFSAIKKLSQVLRLGGAWLTLHPDASVYPGVKFHVRPGTEREHLQIFDDVTILKITEPAGFRRVYYQREEPGQSLSCFRKIRNCE
jgi:SAM-dependent methyltransferase